MEIPTIGRVSNSPFFSGFHKLVTKSSRQIVEITNMLGQIISWAAQWHLCWGSSKNKRVGRDSPLFLEQIWTLGMYPKIKYYSISHNVYSAKILGVWWHSEAIHMLQGSVFRSRLVGFVQTWYNWRPGLKCPHKPGGGTGCPIGMSIGSTDWSRRCPGTIWHAFDQTSQFGTDPSCCEVSDGG